MRISDWSSDVCSSDLLLRKWRPSRSRTRRWRISLCTHPHLLHTHEQRIYGYGEKARQVRTALRTGSSRYHAFPDSLGDYQGAHLLWFRRSEEHTSELQSLMRISYAVFCLKKTKHNYNINSIVLQKY